jgi:hypothetical protein
MNERRSAYFEDDFEGRLGGRVALEQLEDAHHRLLDRVQKLVLRELRAQSLEGKKIIINENFNNNH